MKSCSACRNTYPDDYQVCPRDQTTLVLVGHEIVEGTVLLGKYEILCELGAGGMATVYKARHKAFREVVAVKAVHPRFLLDAGFIKRFRNEAIVARRLNHPNAVRVLDFDLTSDGVPVIVMEFVDGQSLQAALKASPTAWPVDECLHAIMQVAEGLKAAHALGIVHCDIKPANIILMNGPDDKKLVKLLDFGIARVGVNRFEGMTTTMTQQNSVIGTPGYMSPEQIGERGERVIDRRSDLYSLGLVLYEMLTGTHPFEADTPMGMLLHQLNTVPAPPDSICCISPALSALVLKALEKNPDCRFQDASEMLAALQDPEHWYRLQAVGGKAKPSSDVAAGLKPKGTNPAKRRAVGVALSVVALLLIGWAVVHQHQHQQRQVDSQIAVRDEVTKSPPAMNPVRDVAPLPLSKAAAVTLAGSDVRKESPATKRVAIEEKVEPAQETKIVSADLPALTLAIPVTASTPEVWQQREKALRLQGEFEAAFPLASKACDGGNAEGCVDAGMMYQEGRGVTQDKSKAAELYRRGCDGGSAQGCSNLAVFYEKGIGVTGDDTQAVTLAKKGCDGGNSAACRLQGYLLNSGRGVTQDLHEGALALQRACDGGDQVGCINLGMAYEHARGLAQDYPKAISLFQGACDTGAGGGCTSMAYMYEKGEGVAKDYVRAVQFADQACSKGHSLGCALSGYLYGNGFGVARDYMQAVAFSRKGCDGGEAFACNNLARNYRDGQGVVQDKEQAVALFRKACDGRYQAACDALKRMNP